MQTILDDKTLNEALRNGLRPKLEWRRNVPYLQDMRNLVPREHGAQSPTAVTWPIVGSPALSMSWPHPQFLRGDKELYLALETALYTVNESTWAATQITTYDAAAVATPKAIASGGGHYDMATFQSGFFITNGQELIYRIGRHQGGETVVAERAINALEKFQGRLFLGGMSGSHFTSTKFTDALKVWRETESSEVYVSGSEAFDASWIMWTEEGGGDVDVPFATFNDLMGYETAAGLESIWRTLIETGKVGFIPLQHTGEVYELRQHGTSLMAYGEKGVSRITRDGNSYIEQFAGIDAGIEGRGAVGGNKNEHVWTYNDRLWRIKSDGNIADLDYEEFISALGSNKIISFDPRENDYYISDGTIAYILTRQGLGGTTPLAPSSLFRSPQSTSLLGSAAVVTWSDGVPTGDDDVDFSHANIVLAKAVPMDFGRRERKHFSTQRVDTEGLSNLRGTLHYRYKVSESWTRAAQLPGSDEGSLKVIESAVDGAPEMLGTFTALNVYLNSWDIQYQAEDKRFSRARSER